MSLLWQLTPVWQYIIRSVRTPRLESKLYCFNFFFILSESDSLLLLQAGLILSSDLPGYRHSQLRIVRTIYYPPEVREPKSRHRAKALMIGISRIAYFNEDGTCVIGMEAKSIMPLIIFDAVVNVSTRLSSPHHQKPFRPRFDHYADHCLVLPDYLFRSSSEEYVSINDSSA